MKSFQKYSPRDKIKETSMFNNIKELEKINEENLKNPGNAAG